MTPPLDDLDRELARLVAEHQAAEATEVDVRRHVRECPCCNTLAVLVANLRRDLWALLDDGAARR